jgi:rhamnosyltransferase
VVTAFGPGESLVVAVRSLVSQVSRVVVVDDGTPRAHAGSDDVYEECRRIGATVVRHERNRGIGAALNTGLDALSAGPAEVDHVLTLDQDSVLPEGYVASLVAAGRAAEAQGVQVGMVAPGRASGIRSGEGRRTGGVVLGKEPIQSGLLVPSEVLRRIGGFDEPLFIDGVDSEFFLRARAHGYLCVVAPEVHLEHRLGRAAEVRIGPRVLTLVVAADFRYYYQVRNVVELVRRYVRTEPVWAAGAVGKLVRHLVITTTLVPGRRERLHYARRGLRDGLRRVQGPIPPMP